MKANSRDEQAESRSWSSGQAAIASALLAALAGVAITSFIHGITPSGAEERALATSAPSTLTVPSFLPWDSGEVSQFAFGYLEFDWNPANGVPGFDSWPLGSQR